jgi:hypothetical protein
MDSAIEIIQCRACGSKELLSAVDLGSQSLSGVFPIIGEPDPISGPLHLLFCTGCTLIQLKHSFPSELMYGDNYGYRSGLNQSMVQHLSKKANYLFDFYGGSTNSIVLDIGSNDGTLLNSLKGKTPNLYGMDPTSKKFMEYYSSGVNVISDFFSAEKFLEFESYADIIFSIAMFYDLDNPLDFASQIAEVLSPDGVWHLEQSYVLSMIDTNSYDTICHEHVEYYSFTSIEHILTNADLKVIDIELNDINGGSIAITTAKMSSKHTPSEMVSWIRRYEQNKFSDPLATLSIFSQNIARHKESLTDLLESLRKQEKRIWGIGASTKGNVMLQYCDITPRLVEKIVDVNPYKHGRWTPTTHIPIVSEDEFNTEKVDYALVLPWHFKASVVARSDEFSRSGGKLIFPLPIISFV